MSEVRKWLATVGLAQWAETQQVIQFNKQGHFSEAIALARSSEGCDSAEQPGGTLSSPRSLRRGRATVRAVVGNTREGARSDDSLLLRSDSHWGWKSSIREFSIADRPLAFVYYRSRS
jgi:hypothetical protein